MNLSVAASGSGPLTYKWLRKGKTIAGATSSTLAISSATYTDTGWYVVDVTDGTGTTRSVPLFVLVAPTRTQNKYWTGTSYQNSDFNNAFDVIAVAAGITQSLALRRDGTALFQDYSGSYIPPAIPSTSDLVAVGVGQHRNVALKSDGTIFDSAGNYLTSANALGDMPGCVDIAVADLHAVVLKSDGTVIARGENSSGQSSVPFGLTNIAAVAASYYNSYALRNDGTLFIWGDNYYGVVTQSGMTGVAAVAAGTGHFVALKTDGTVVAVGDNSYGQCNVPAGLTNVIAISAGSHQSVALKQDGTVLVWGASQATLTLPSLTDVFRVSAGGNTTILLRDASTDTVPVVTMPPLSQAAPEAQPLVLSVTATGAAPMTYQWRKDGVDITNATGSSLSFASVSVFDAGSYDVVVTDYLGSTTSAAAVLTVTELPAISASDPTYRVILPGGNTVLVPSYTGPGAQSYQWLRNGRVLAGATGASLSLTNVGPSDSGYYFADILDANGMQRSPPIFVSVVPAKTQVREWGAGVQLPATDSITAIAARPGAGLGLKRNGVITQLGVGGIPLPVGLSGVVEISGSQKHALALKKDATVVAWGDNTYGQTTVPAGLSGVVAVSAGSDHSLALKSNGTVTAWGNNAWGQCNVPSNLSHVVAVFASDLFSLAIKDDATVVTWGNYSQSQLIGSQTGVAAIASYPGYHLVVLNQDGSVSVIGGDEYSQSTVPSGLTRVTAVAAGAFHTLAQKVDGTVVCWGRNLEGQATVPDNLADVFSVSAGLTSSYAIRDATSDTAPVITNQPATLVKIETDKAIFSVSVTGPGPYSYQWRKDGLDIAGATTAALTLVDLTLADAGNYDVVVSNYVGSTMSLVAGLTVNPIPVITSLSAPRNLLNPGQSLNLSVTATGTGSLSYQWTHNSHPIAGATNTSLALTNVDLKDAGYYWVDVTDSVGTRHSSPLFIILAPSTSSPVTTQVRGWGSNALAPIPAGLTDVVAVSSLEYNVVAIRRDGTVVSWGVNSNSAPIGLNNVVAVAAGYNHALALKSDGTVVGWGDNTFKQTTVPAGLTNVVAIACGLYHCLALKSDGTVVAWGAEFTPQYSYYYNGQATVPMGLSNVVSIAAGPVLSAALKNDGSVVVWGSGSDLSGQSEVAAIAAGTNHVLLLKTDGTVAGWGYNGDTQVSIPNGLTGVMAVAAGGDHSLALKSDGTVVAWGSNYASQANVPAGLPDVFAIAAGHDFSVALRDASADTAPGLSTLSAQSAGEEQTISWNITATGAGPFTYQWRKNGLNLPGAISATLTLVNLVPADAGSYDVVVTNYKGSTASNSATLTVLPIPVITNQSPSRQVRAPGQDLTLNVIATGTGTLKYQWSHNGQAITGATGNSFSVSNLSLPDSGWYLVDVTDDNGTRRSDAIFVMVAPSQTKVVGWGFTNYAATSVSSPQNDIIAVSSGGDHSLALRSDGTVLAFGRNIENQCNVPAGLNGVVAVAAGSGHSLALKSDGTVVGWGYNTDGQTSIPAGLSGVVAIAAGGRHSLALKSDGTVLGWGWNGWNQITIPANLSGVTTITAGDTYSLALKSDGTVVAWGSNVSGETNVPAGLTSVVAVAAGGSSGDNHSLALRKDGTVVGWGTNSWGQATAPAGLGEVFAIAGGFQNSLVLKKDGTVFGWGSNVGYGLNPPSDLARAYAISTKTAFTLALVGESTPAIYLQPTGVVQKESQPVTLSVGVTGRSSLTYQWRKNGVNIPGATAANLVFEETLLSDAGAYDVVITNNLGSATSRVAAVEIVPIPVVTGMSPRRSVISPGAALTMSVTATGTGALNYQWFHNRTPIGAATSPAYTIASAIQSDNGWYHVEITDANGTRRSSTFFVNVVPALRQLVAWGSFGAGSTLPPAGLNDGIMVAAGTSHALVLRNDGSVQSLGLAEDPGAELMVLAGLTDVVAIADSDYGFSLALKSDGSVVAWGRNEVGQTNVPVGLKDVVAISAGGRHALALKSNGTVVAWGQNVYGQSTVPQGLADVVGIAASATQSLAVKRDGSVVGWGSDASYFVGVPSLSEVVSASAAGSNWMALRADGTVTTWGYWGYTDPPSLAPPNGLSQVIAISAAAFHSLALRSDGTVVGWGYNQDGSGVPPADLTRVFAIASGTGFSLALAEVTPPVFTAQPVGKAVLLGGSVMLTASATAVPAPTYQWQKDGVDIAGATSSSFTIGAMTAGDVGSYRLVATNIAGSAISDRATLTVRSSSDFNLDGHPDLVWQNRNSGERGFWMMNGTAVGTYVKVTDQSTDWEINGYGDFDGDGQTDLIWSNVATGERKLWLMDGAVKSSEVPLATVGTEWEIAGVGDFNGDGKPDIVWQNTISGQRGMWLMNGTQVGTFIEFATVGTEWQICGTGDFNGDGKPDIVWQNTISGERGMWLMNGTQVGTYIAFATVGTEWSIVGAADFNGDGKTDIVWQNAISGERGMWLMNGTQVGTYIAFATVGTEWSLGRMPYRRAVADFNADNQPDIIWSNTTTGERGFWIMNGLSVGTYMKFADVATQWRIAGSADFNADSKADIIWENTVTGERGFWIMNGTSVGTYMKFADVGTEWRIAGSADFNADSKADIIWENTVTGERGFWIMNGTSVGTYMKFADVGTEWRIAGAADFNGDAKPDIIWENTTTGERGFWVMNGTSVGYYQSFATLSTDWQLKGAADFNHDGKPDIIRQNTVTGERGVWFMNGMTAGTYQPFATVGTEWTIGN